jgi:predicted acylesterase/phospholipase RssA
MSPTSWYQDSAHRLFYGVFEGGGVKGIAYAGALLALRTQRCWFRGVAGASAGAITAALVAAGMTPEQIATATDNAMKAVRTGFWAGLWNLRSQDGFFASDSLRDWLDQTLHTSLSLSSKDPVAFKQLYEDSD